MLEEITTKEDEELLYQKVRSKKRVRGLLVGINVCLACYFVFELVLKVIDSVSNSNQSDIITLNGYDKEKSLELYDRYILKDKNSNYQVTDVYDFGIYGGYLHLSDCKITNGNYFSLENSSIITLKNVVDSSYDVPYKFNDNTSQYLNKGIDLFSLEYGDYLVLDGKYFGKEDLRNKGIKIRSSVGIEKTIYSLPDENNDRKKVTIKSKDSSPCLVISVSRVDSLPDNYYDYVVIGSNENNESFDSNLRIYYVDKIDNLEEVIVESFNINSNYCVCLGSNIDETIVYDYIDISNLDNVSHISDKDEFKDYSCYFKELGGNLTFSGECNKDEPITKYTKPYLTGYDIGKFVVLCSNISSVDKII